jgi:uncharacterized protein YndB with AHSA1/START domain
MSADPGELRLHMEHVLPAPRPRVFALFTEASELPKWWGPHGFRTPSVEVDLRLGGTYRFAMQPPDGDLFHLAGEFVEVDPPARLVYTFRWRSPTRTTRRRSSRCRSRRPARGRPVSRSRRGNSAPRRAGPCTSRGGRTRSRSFGASCRRTAWTSPATAMTPTSPGTAAHLTRISATTSSSTARPTPGSASRPTSSAAGRTPS